VVIAGGGTGGHLFPGVALAREFMRQRKDTAVVFVGTSRGIESRVLPREGFELRLIPIGGWVGVTGLRKIRTMMMLPAGLWKSWQILKEIRPELVIGVGGYASGPVMAMAGWLGIRRVLVEPNAVPGLTNRFLAPWVNRIYLSFEETRAWLNRGIREGAIRVFGNPVRADIFSAGKSRTEKSAKMTVLVMGGSQGSRAINHGMADALPELEAWRPKLRIIHQSGEHDVVWLKEKYSRLGFDAAVVPFIPNVSEAYRDADLVLCRSGATTVAELAACGRPAVLVPFPHATHGHQERNARALAEAGAAELLLERDLTGKSLAAILQSLLSAPTRLSGMAEASRRLGRPDAAEKIVSDCLELLGVPVNTRADN